MKTRLRALGLPVTPETEEWAQVVGLTEDKLPAVLEPMGMTKGEARDVAYAEKRAAKGTTALAEKRRRIAHAFVPAA